MYNNPAQLACYQMSSKPNLPGTFCLQISVLPLLLQNLDCDFPIVTLKEVLKFVFIEKTISLFSFLLGSKGLELQKDANLGFFPRSLPEGV